MASHPAVAPGHQAARKAQVLTRPAASTVETITDAVIAKAGEPFFLCRPDGQVPCVGPHGHGFYHHDCRFLSGYELTIGGSDARPLADDELSGDRLSLELTNSDLSLPDGSSIAKDQLAIRWDRRIDASGPVLEDEIGFVNYAATSVRLPLELRFSAGFEDVFAIRGLLARCGARGWPLA